MDTCEVCGNEYDKALRVIVAGDAEAHVFDSFECAIHALAPTCAHCACTVLGHGVESDGAIFCCAHCAAACGVTDVRDRAAEPAPKEPAVAHRTRGGSGGSRRGTRGKIAERSAGTDGVGISKQSTSIEARDQRSLPERGQARH